MTDRIRSILENIIHWDTCPEDYREDIQEFLASEPQQEALNIADVGGNEVALKLKQFAEQQQDIPGDIQAIINEKFWDLI